MKRLLLATVAALFVGLLLLLPGGTAQSSPTAPGVDNPHDRADACSACHIAKGEPSQRNLGPVVTTCRGCHPDADMHPVGMEPDEVPVSEGWFLEDNKVVCGTCHAEPSCDAERPKEAPWLRGGPYLQTRDLCYQCHQRSGFQRQDPHHPEAPRAQGDPSCAACHSGLPIDGARPKASRLRVTEKGLCAFCHDGEDHLGVSTHLGVEVPAAAREGLPAVIALDDEGRIRCWTCHEVHGPAPTAKAPKSTRVADALREQIRERDWAGEVPPQPVWPQAADDAAHPSMLSLPLEDGSLCEACHGEGGAR